MPKSRWIFFDRNSYLAIFAFLGLNWAVGVATCAPVATLMVRTHEKVWSKALVSWSTAICKFRLKSEPPLNYNKGKMKVHNFANMSIQIKVSKKTNSNSLAYFFSIYDNVLQKKDDNGILRKRY